MQRRLKRRVKPLCPIDQRTLTAAVSFRSNRDLMKRYGAMFNKMTLGFEAEVSGGTGISNSNQLDMDDLRESFSFDFTYQEFLDKYSIGKSALELFDAFDIESPYGFAGPEETLAIRNIWVELQKIGFRVMGLPMQNQEPIMEEPSLHDYQSPNGEKQHFSLRDERLFNTKFVISKATENLEALRQFMEKHPIEPTSNRVSLYVTEAQIDIVSAIRWLENPDIANDDIQLRRWIYECGNSIAKLKRGLFEIHNYCKGRGEIHHFIVVKTEKGGLKIINASRYKDDGGILSSPLVWTDTSRDFFQDTYEMEKSSARDRAWDSHVEDAQSSLDEENSDVITTIYEYVADNVDPDAKLSQGYHESDEYKGEYTVVEGDSSISPAGAEIVSPVFTGVNNGLSWLNKVFDMIENYDLETNETTGLHVNIGTFTALSAAHTTSVSKETPIIDVVKLAVLSGDRYLLKQFGREHNTYAKSIENNLIELAKSGFDLKDVNSNLWDSLATLNNKFVRNQRERYRTINMQHLVNKGYLEFRIAGGINYHKDKEKIAKSILRYMQLCAIACDRQAYFKEYMTELYKLFIGSTIPDPAIDTKAPRPKNPIEASYVLRQWSSDQYTNGREGLNRDALKIMRDALAENANLREDQVLDIIAGLNADNYKSVTNNVLYSLRLLMIYTARQQNNPKQYLRDIFAKHLPAIKSHVAPKLYRNKPGWVRFFYTGQMTGQEMTAMTEITAASDKKIDAEFNTYYKELKTKDRSLFKKQWSSDVLADNYFTARNGGATDKEARMFSKKMLDGFNKVPPGQLDSTDDIAPDLKKQLDKYKRIADNKSKERNKRRDEDLNNEIDMYASDSYTNKSKKVKIIYYANRSTPQVVKPGQTVKAKKGYGKRTKIRSATDAEVGQFKKGVWLRTRENGAKATDKGAKQSRYRPKLAAKSRAAAKRRKLVASETNPSLAKYIELIHGSKK